MIRLNRGAIIPLKEFTKVFSENPHVFYDIEGLEGRTKSMMAKIRGREVQLLSFLYNYLGFQPKSLNRSLIEKLLTAAYVEPRFYVSKEDKFTYTHDTRQQMIEAGILEDFNALYDNMEEVSTEHSKIIKLIQRSYNRETVEGNYGPLKKVPFEVVASRNCRFNTSNENVIGMHRGINPYMESRKGYLLIQGDFPQIDGRGALNIYFKSSFTNDLMNTVDDSYLVYKEMARWFPYLQAKYELDKTLDNPEAEDTTKFENIINKFQTEVMPFDNRAHRDIYKVIALQTVYNSSSSPLLNEDREIKKLSAALNSMPIYAAMRHYALYLKKTGYTVTVRSLFGYERDITETREFTFLAQVFNSPIQSTSSEIIIYVIMKILNYFTDMGAWKDKIRLYLNRHDEPILEIEEEFFKEHYEFFNDVSWISVQGWRPFKIDWMVSHRYGTPIQKYTELVNKVEECPDNVIVDAPQFFPLKLPRIMAFMKKELVDDRVIFLLSEFVGEFPQDGFSFGKFKDKRDIIFDARVSHLNGEIIDTKYIYSVINTLIEPLSSDINFLVYVDGTESLTHLTMDDKNVWITGVPNDLAVINNSIMAMLLNQIDPLLIDDQLKYWLDMSSRLSGRVRHRSEKDL